jgi:hypothetical protein
MIIGRYLFLVSPLERGLGLEIASEISFLAPGEL